MSLSSELKKGALVNFFGVVGKMAAPTFLVVVNRLYGPDVFGIYITANITIEIIIAFLSSGFKDGALIFVARFADNKDDQKDLYTALSNAFAWSIGFSVIVLLIGIFWGADILQTVYKDEFSSELTSMFSLMLFSIPLMAFERNVLAATQGLKIMKYDAINNGWFRPIALLVFSVLFWMVNPSVIGMALAYVTTQALLFVVSVFIYSKELSWTKLGHAFKTFKVNAELVEFAIPQSLNMTLNRFITGIDILMLPAFGFSPTVVGFYGAGSMLVREIRSVKMIFSTAFAPYIVRLHKEKMFEELSHHFSKTAAWIASIAIPIILLVAIFKDVFLAFIHPEYSANSSFVYFLLPIPYLYCCFSLSGNVVAMTGHSKLTLMNSIIVSSTNIILNLILIPEYGIIGAASASSIAMFILVCFETIEARIVAKTKFYLKDMIRPHLAGFLASLFLVFGLISDIKLFTIDISNPVLLATGSLLIFGAGVGTSFINKVKSKIVN
ncbi:MAG: oligosaccharide flippase family protein [Balneola sp.]